MTSPLAAFFDSFVNPGLLLGLFLLSAPIIIHFLNKRHYQVVHWAAMDFLFQAESKNRRRLRLEDIILLLLRILLLGLLVFAVARPLVRGLGGSREDERVVILDDSFSMETSEGAGTAFSAAKAGAVSQVEDAVGRSIPVSVWLGTRPELGPRELSAIQETGPGEGEPSGTSTETAALADGSALADRSAQVLGHIRAAEPSDLPLNFARLLERLGASFEAKKDAPMRSVVLLSDFRASDWLEEGSAALRSDIRAVLADLEKRGLLQKIRWRFVDVGEASRENLAVTAVRVDKEHPMARVPARIIVEVRNFGLEDRKLVAGELEVGDGSAPRLLPRAKESPQPTTSRLSQPTPRETSQATTRETSQATTPEASQPTTPEASQPTTPGAREGERPSLFKALHRIPLPKIDLVPAGKTVTTEVQFTFEKAGNYLLAARLEGDRLPRDDTSFDVARVRDGLRVIVVDGDPGQGRFSGESGFVLPALAPRGSVPSGILPRRVVKELEEKEAMASDVVILCNREGVTQEERAILERFLHRGGGVAFFLGNRVAAERYRETFDEKGLFPALLKGIKESSKRCRLGISDPKHPAFEVFRGVEGSSLEQVGFDRFFALEPASGAAVVARYDDPARTPAILDAAAGKGRVALFNMSADRDWNDWPADPSYPIVLQEWVRYLAPRSGANRSFTAGDLILWETAPGVQYTAVTPRGEAVRVSLLRGSEEASGGASEASGANEEPASLSAAGASFGATYLAGFYCVIPSPSVPGAAISPELLEPSWYACRRDPRESDLEPAGEPRLRDALGSAGVEFTMGKDVEVDVFQKNEEGETWRWLSFGAGLFLLIELLAAWSFGRR
jgi:hypothetical protein